ncbi:MAG: hypothetical protein LBB38_01455 [Puniceicoccales bacterium]|jgi:hypothetical protein|nr:hypothetical protein [Puniceicoccales bacterium]
MSGLVGVKNPSAIPGVFTGNTSTNISVQLWKTQHNITCHNSIVKYFKKNPVTFWHNYYRMIAQGYWPIFAFIGAIFTYFFRTRLVIEFVAALLLNGHGKNSSPSGGGTGGPGGAAGGDSHLLHTRPSGASTASILQAATAGGEQQSGDDPSPTPLPQIVPAVALVVANPPPALPTKDDSSSTTSDASEDAVDDAPSSDSPPPAAAATGAGIAQVKALSELIGDAVDEINRLADEQNITLCDSIFEYLKCLVGAKEILDALVVASKPLTVDAFSLYEPLAYYVLLFTAVDFENLKLTGWRKDGDETVERWVNLDLSPTITIDIANAFSELVVQLCAGETFSFEPIRSGRPICPSPTLHYIIACAMQYKHEYTRDLGENNLCKLVVSGRDVTFDAWLEFSKMLRVGDAKASYAFWFRDAYSLQRNFFSTDSLTKHFGTKDIFDSTGAQIVTAAGGEKSTYVSDGRGIKVRVLGVGIKTAEVRKPDCSIAFRPNGIVYETLIAALKPLNKSMLDSERIAMLCRKLRDTFFYHTSDDGKYMLNYYYDLLPCAAGMFEMIAHDKRTPETDQTALLTLAEDIRRGEYDEDAVEPPGEGSVQPAADGD